MQYVFKTRRYFGNPLREGDLEAWKAECMIKFGTGVALPVKKIPGVYAYYVDKQPETYTTSYGEWTAQH